MGRYYSPGSIDYPFIYSHVSLLHLILLNYSCYVSKIIEMHVWYVPNSILRIALLQGFLLATQGTIKSADMAMKRKKVIHIGGGLHHANFNGGEGFCTYNDIGLACKYLLDNYGEKIKKILIIDLDAHQGNGHERDKEILGDSLVIADIYNPFVYPKDDYAKKFIDFCQEVSIKDSSRDYLIKLDDMLQDIEK